LSPAPNTASLDPAFAADPGDRSAQSHGEFHDEVAAFQGDSLTCTSTPTTGAPPNARRTERVIQNQPPNLAALLALRQARNAESPTVGGHGA
jgi:hypothetical protein